MPVDKEMLVQNIKTLVAEILELDDPTQIDNGARLREDLGMDSLGSLEMLSRLSEELDLDLEMDAAMEISTVHDACALIEKSLVEKQA